VRYHPGMAREREGRGVDAQGQAKARQRQQDEDRHEEAGLPRKHVEADDVPDDGTPG
jgi:hypothetical protein